jgi:DNA-binding PadR family transcriptional regulator
MGKEYLGELEELVLTIVGILGDDAYGYAIVKEIKQQLKRSVSLPSAHVTLYRLQDKGYVKSSVGGATNKRGGRSKRIFKITASGVAILKSMKQDRMRLWNLTPQLR